LALAALIFIFAVCAIALRPPALAAELKPDPMPVSSIGEPITVHVDQAKVLKLPDRTATLVVGNPLIADVAVQPGGIVVITAKSHGATNLVALDRNGTILMEHPVQVLGPTDRIVVIYRGIDRESYSCTPTCERRITLGDAPNYFTATLTQTGNLNAQAQGEQQK
jgi:Flp pilus assembly secretin CpaC